MLHRLVLGALLVGAALAPTAVPTHERRWVVPIDSRTSDQWLSTRGSSVYALRGGRVIALDVATGRVRWTSTDRFAGRPAAAGDAIYAPREHGLTILDAASGRERARIAMRTMPQAIATDATAVVVDEDRGVTTIRGYAGTTTPRWTRRIRQNVGVAAATDGSALFFTADDASVLVIDATDGRAVAATDDVTTYVGRDRRTYWFVVANGGLKGIDLDTGRTIAVHNGVTKDAVRVEGVDAVAVVAGHLVRLRLPTGTPVALHVDGRWVGGPVDGVIFVGRGDGTYAQRLSDGRSVRLVTKTNDTHFLTAAGADAYFATNDGSIVVADLAGLKPLVRRPTACTFVEGVHVVPGGALVHCDKDKESLLYAFAR